MKSIEARVVNAEALATAASSDATAASEAAARSEDNSEVLALEIQVENAAAAIEGLRREIEAKDADYANGQNEEWAQAKAGGC